MAVDEAPHLLLAVLASDEESEFFADDGGLLVKVEDVDVGGFLQTAELVVEDPLVLLRTA